MKNKKLLSLLLIGIITLMPAAGLFGLNAPLAQAATNLIPNPSLETAQISGNATVSATVTVTVAATTPSPILTSVVITSGTPVVMISGTVSLTTTPLDQNGVPFSGATTTFASSAPAVATVDSASGVVTGVTAGTATITATSISGNTTVTGTATVTVVTTPTTAHNLISVVTVPLTPTLTPTETVTLNAIPLDQNDVLINSGVTTTFVSNNPSVATVDSATGLLTGVSAGTATITVTSVTLGTSMPQGWQEGSYGTNNATFSYLNTGHTGSHSAQIQMTSYTDGDAKWYVAPIAVQSDTQYVFSDYYEANVATEIDVAFTMSDGTTINQIIGLPEPASTWAKFTTQFSVPLGAQTVAIYHVLNQVGSLTIDDQSLTTYTPTPFNRALLSLTFDGGFESTYTNGLPLLTKNGFISTQYIITDLLGTEGDNMTNAQVQSLYAAGHEIASHTVTHDNMLTEPSSQWTTELSQSQTTLQNLTGAAVTDLAFPNGLYNNAIVAATKTYYTSARGVEDALNSKDNFNAYDIKVQNMFNTTTPAQVADWVKQAQDTKTWLVLVYHSIDPTDPSIYNVTPTNLDTELTAIKTSGITVLPINQALSELLPQTGIQPTLNSIAITSPATKLAYTVGDPLSIAGLVVTGTYSDGSTKVEQIAASNITGFDSSAPITSQTLTVSFGGKTATYTISVASSSPPPSPTLESIAITTPATKLAYTVGDPLDIAGLVVTGTNSDASTQVEPITASNVTGFDSSAPATSQVLTITVGGKTTTYTVSIAAAATTGGGGSGGSGGFSGGGGVGVTSGGGYLYNRFPVLPTTTTNISPSKNISPSGRVLGAQAFHFSSTLKRGSRGNEVVQLQNFLNGMGYDVGNADGIFGNKVRASLIKFQIANKIKGDGIVGSSTRKILNSTTLTSNNPVNNIDSSATLTLKNK